MFIVGGGGEVNGRGFFFSKLAKLRSRQPDTTFKAPAQRVRVKLPDPCFHFESPVPHAYAVEI